MFVATLLSLLLAQSYGEGFGMVQKEPPKVIPEVPPTFRGFGTMTGNLNSFSPTLPSGVESGDLLVMYCETQQGDVATASGWSSGAQACGGTGTGGSCLNRLYKIAESSTPTTTVDDSGQHQICVVGAFAVGTFTGSPAGTSGGRPTAMSGWSIPGHTPPSTNCAILTMSSSSTDGNRTDICSSWNNSNLVSVGEVVDQGLTVGNGGGLCIYHWTLATATATGSTTVTGSSDVGGEATEVICP